MRKITDIYKEYKIMPNLVMHQLRVAAVAKQICESLDVEVDSETIVKACLLHDMGNIIKFDLSQTQAIFGYSDLEIQDIKKTKDEFIEKYGHDEEKANAEIARELGSSEEIISLILENDFKNLCNIKVDQDFKSQILKYADLRTGPKGILSYEDRMYEAGKRYKDHKNKVEEEEWNRLFSCGKEIEKQIFFAFKY